jgi:hypothetical protein
VYYREEIEEKIAHQDTGLSPGCGCMIWLLGIFGTAFLLFLIDVIWISDWHIFGPPPTFWESLSHWLFIFAPQSIFIVIYAILRRRKTHPRTSTLCKHCGYDLRATPNPTGPRLPTCPECGVPSSPPTTPK